MLVNKKQEWDVYEHQPVTPDVTGVVKNRRLNIVLRAKCFITVLMVVLIAMFVTVQSEAIVRSGYQLVQIKAQLSKIEKENENLRLDIAKLKAPQRIQQIATNELGMIVPPSVYRATKSDASKGQDQKASKAVVEDKSATGRVLNFLSSSNTTVNKELQ